MILWLASYPRSGNTFLRTLLFKCFGQATYSKYNDSSDIGKSASLANAVGHKNYPGAWDAFYDDAVKSEKLHIIKTHDAPPDDQKAIYVIRDATATVVSYYHYLERFSTYKADICDVIAGAVSFGDWSQHYHDWNPAQRPNTLLLKFEELTGDVAGSIKKIADFTGLDYGKDMPPDFSKLNEKFPEFFRSGSNTRNREELTEQELTFLQFMHGDLMQELGYSITAENNMSAVKSAIISQSEKLRKFRISPLSNLTNKVTRLSENFDARDRYADDLNMRLQIKAKKIEELAKLSARQGDELDRQRNEISGYRTKLQDLEQQLASNAASLAQTGSALESMKNKNRQLEQVLAPNAGSILKLRALRYVLAERRRQKAAQKRTPNALG